MKNQEMVVTPAHAENKAFVAELRKYYGQSTDTAILVAVVDGPAVPLGVYLARAQPATPSQ